jgi:hypothetical protein
MRYNIHATILFRDLTLRILTSSVFCVVAIPAAVRRDTVRAGQDHLTKDVGTI